MSTRPRVLVVGSYPPIPLPAAAATMAAVQRAWADGDEVTVASPRLSAAHLAVPVVGLLAGRRLGNLHRHTGASRLVMVLEPGLPVPSLPPGQSGSSLQPGQSGSSLPPGQSGSSLPPGQSGSSLQPGRLIGRMHQWLTVEALRPALATFEHVTFVRVGDLGMSPWVERRLLGSGTEVVEEPPSPASTAPEAVGVTTLGPVEVPPRERPQQIAGVLARRVLGPYAGPIRARVGAVVRPLRR